MSTRIFTRRMKQMASTNIKIEYEFWHLRHKYREGEFFVTIFMMSISAMTISFMIIIRVRLDLYACALGFLFSLGI